MMVVVSFEDINDKYLRIGRQRREEEKLSEIFGRKITGKKGLGKLALFGIGKNIEVITKTKNQEEAIKFTMRWDDIITCNEKEYKPVFEKTNWNLVYGIQGTQIKLTDIKRKSDFNVEDIKEKLAKMFNFSVKDFKIYIQKNSDIKTEITKDLKYNFSNKEFEYVVEEVVKELNGERFVYKDKLRGRIITTEKPMKPDYKGITLYANGRLVENQSFFGLSEAGHFYAYVTGYIDVDFIDEIDKDLISTNRQSLIWEEEETNKLQYLLQEIIKLVQKKWRVQRKEKKDTKINEKLSEAKIDRKNWISKVSNNKQVQNNLDDLLECVTNEDSDLEKTITKIYELLPIYVEYHYRFLHKSIQDVSKKYYRYKNYYTALLEACKEYKNQVKLKAKKIDQSIKFDDSDRNLMGQVFGSNNKKILKVFKDKVKQDGTQFETATINDLEDSQLYLSQGIITGYRNPLSHEICEELKNTEIITEKHCLDVLSLLSLLFERLDNVK